jgi:hypothetical protein
MREDNDYCWAVVCKNQWFHLRSSLFKGHRIPLAKAAAGEISMPPVDGGFSVRCDKCSEEYVYQPAEVRRYEQKLPESFRPHPLFQLDRDRRRSPRSRRDVRLIVRGESGGNAAFEEKTYATCVSDHGALMILSATVEVGQSLVLKNPRTQDEIQSQVVRFGPLYKGRVQVGVEFPHPAREFWHGEPQVGSNLSNSQSSAAMGS